MNKWIPYVVAAVIGLGVAFVAFMPSAPKEKAKVAKVEKAEKPTKIVNMGDDGVDINRAEDATKTPAQVVQEAKDNPPPPPGTLRPMNEGEIRQAARLERPFNKHTAHASSFWNQAGRLLGSANPDLAQEVQAMVRYLRDQANEDEIDAAAIIAREKALTAKIRAGGFQDAQLDGILTYIDESGQAVLDGKDPTTVVKPTKK